MPASPCPSPSDLLTQAFGSLLGSILAATPEWVALTRTVDEIKELVMSLTNREQQAIDDLASALNTMSTDLQAILQSAQDAKAALQTQIDTLTAQGQTDQATIAGLQAAADQVENDVVGALAPITSRVLAIDQGLQTPSSQGGTPLDTSGSGGSPTPLAEGDTGQAGSPAPQVGGA